MNGPRSIVVLTADDYAMTEGVSRAIEELAQAKRLSATGAMVTFATWSRHAPRIRKLRNRVAVGLHFNLTLGAPLGRLAMLAPAGVLPAIGQLTRLSLTSRLDLQEIEDEMERQLDAFEAQLGVRPDYIDGHQHAHSLPQVRVAVLRAISRRRWSTPVLIRDPGAGWSDARRRGQGLKAYVLAALSGGFGSRARAAGLTINDTFGGVTGFREESAAEELQASMVAPGRLHIAMCHPGYVDAELISLDPVTQRRRAELNALLAMNDLDQQIWHPVRSADGPPIDWQAELASL